MLQWRQGSHILSILFSPRGPAPAQSTIDSQVQSQSSEGNSRLTSASQSRSKNRCRDKRKFKWLDAGSHDPRHAPTVIQDSYSLSTRASFSMHKLWACSWSNNGAWGAVSTRAVLGVGVGHVNDPRRLLNPYLLSSEYIRRDSHLPPPPKLS